MRLTTARGVVNHGGRVYVVAAITAARMSEVVGMAGGEPKLLALGRAVYQGMPVVPDVSSADYHKANVAWHEAYYLLSELHTRAVDHVADYGHRLKWLTAAATVVSVDGELGPDDLTARVTWLRSGSTDAAGLARAVEAWLGDAAAGKG